MGLKISRLFKLYTCIYIKTYNRKTYTYILGCNVTRSAVIVDPVDVTVNRDVNLLKELDLNLKYAINTHCHADHITGTKLLKETFKNVKSMIAKHSGAKADVYLNHNDVINFGNQNLLTKSTPGHTNGCLSFINDTNRFVLTGDTLMIRKCGRTDFQQGSAGTLYDSVHNHLFTLDDDYLVYPGHDYAGFTVSSIGEEKKFNPRLSGSRENCISILDNLNLAYPAKIDEAVPRNMVDGENVV